MVARAYRMGIPIVAATDFDYGEEKTDLTVAREASELATIGLPLGQVIKSITSRAESVSALPIVSVRYEKVWKPTLLFSIAIRSKILGR